MVRSFLWRPVAVAAVAAVGLLPLSAQGNRGSWGPAVGGTQNAPAFPDVHATYWLFSFRVSGSQPVAFRIRGDFVFARYASLNLYDLETTGVVGTLRDADIEPDPGSNNPFRPGTPRGATPRQFTAWLVPEGSPRKGGANVLVVPNGVAVGTLILRVYRPDQGLGSAGGVALPTIEAFDDRTMQPVQTARFEVSPEAAAQQLIAAAAANGAQVRAQIRATVADPISFFRVRFGAGFPNGDADYLVAGLSTAPPDAVAVLRFRVPMTPDTFGGGGVFGGEEVRYWSMNVGADYSTVTLDGLCDDEVVVDAQGMVTLVVGPASVRAFAERAGFGFLERGAQRWPRSLLFRHLVTEPSFAAPISSVPIFDPTLPLDPQRAERFMGDYAPTGRYCTVAEFLAALPQRWSAENVTRR